MIKRTCYILFNLTLILLLIVGILSCENPLDYAHQNELTDNAMDTTSGSIVKEGYLFDQLITYEYYNGLCLFQGDIELPPEWITDTPSKGCGKTDLDYRWEHTVPYIIDSGFPNTYRVTDAIAHIEARTGLKFVSRNSESNYIKFIKSTQNSSPVGMRGGEQTIRILDSGSTGTVIHEICHSLGMWHEHSRSDRDNYIEIHWNNIESGKEHNFYTHNPPDNFDHGSFDFNSIMLYSSYAFSDNDKPTITTLDGNTFNSQRNGLSSGDKACLNAMYPQNSWKNLLKGLYFPKASYSQLRFEINTNSILLINSLRVDIERIDDSYTRYLTVFLDGAQIHRSIIGSSGFHGDIGFVSFPGSHRLVLQINYGGWKTYGWKLTNISLAFGGVDAIYFPQTNASQLIFDTRTGENTEMTINIARQDDTYARYFSTYVDGTVRVPESWNYVLPWYSSHTFDIGDYTEDSIHKLTLQVRYGGYKEWGWKLLLNPQNDFGIAYLATP